MRAGRPAHVSCVNSWFTVGAESDFCVVSKAFLLLRWQVVCFGGKRHHGLASEHLRSWSCRQGLEFRLCSQFPASGEFAHWGRTVPRHELVPCS